MAMPMVPTPPRAGADSGGAVIGPGGFRAPIETAAGVPTAARACRTRNRGEHAERERETGEDAEEGSVHRTDPDIR